MEIAMTTMSSKGQIVIPAEMREDIAVGDKLIVIQANDRIILKKASLLDENFEQDVAFAKKTDEALKRYEKGEFASLPADKFLEALKDW